MPSTILSFASALAGWLPTSFKRLLYHLGPITSVLRSTLNRAAPQGITVVSVAGGRLQGIRMALDLQSEKDYWLGTYEIPLQEAIHDWIKPGWIVYDVGANVGYVSLLLARQVAGAGHVTAFEALPANVERLKTNVGLNQLSTLVTVMPCAVSRENGTARFHVGASDDTGRLEGSAGRLSLSGEYLEVPTLSLDEYAFVERNRLPQAVKMDIEGGEVLALQGMKRLLREAHPLMLIEIHSEQAAEMVWDALTKAGYELLHMQKGYTRVRSMKEMGRKAYVVARAAD